MNNFEPVFGPINIKTQELSIIASLILFFVVFYLVRKKHLKSGYSILWFFISILIFFLSIFIDILYWFSNITGIYYPTSAIFAVLIVGMILISIHYSVVISKHEAQIKILAQENAIIKDRLLLLERARVGRVKK